MEKNIHFLNLKYLFFTIVILILIFSLIPKLFSCRKLGCIHMTGLDGFRMKDVYRDDKDIYRALYGNNTDIIRAEIRNVKSENEAIKIIEAQTARMKALFENAAAPYPGEISDEIVCDKKYKPLFTTENINGLSMAHFTGYLNGRLTFGACTRDQAIYRGIEALFYCKTQNKLYQLEIIAPENVFTGNESKYEDMRKSIRCL